MSGENKELGKLLERLRIAWKNGYSLTAFKSGVDDARAVPATIRLLPSVWQQVDYLAHFYGDHARRKPSSRNAIMQHAIHLLIEVTNEMIDNNDSELLGLVAAAQLVELENRQQRRRRDMSTIDEMASLYRTTGDSDTKQECMAILYRLSHSDVERVSDHAKRVLGGLGSRDD